MAKAKKLPTLALTLYAGGIGTIDTEAMGDESKVWGKLLKANGFTYDKENTRYVCGFAEIPALKKKKAFEDADAVGAYLNTLEFPFTVEAAAPEEDEPEADDDDEDDEPEADDDDEDEPVVEAPVAKKPGRPAKAKEETPAPAAVKPGKPAKAEKAAKSESAPSADARLDAAEARITTLEARVGRLLSLVEDDSDDSDDADSADADEPEADDDAEADDEDADDITISGTKVDAGKGRTTYSAALGELDKDQKKALGALGFEKEGKALVYTAGKADGATVKAINKLDWISFEEPADDDDDEADDDDGDDD